MTDELDPNKITAEFVTANIDRLAEGAGAGLRGISNAIRLRLAETYKQYLIRLLERRSKAKSFLIRDEPRPLYEFFVPLDVSSGAMILQRASINSIAEASGGFAVLMGSGGSGKSMLMRHLLIGCIASRAKVPVFIELRQLDRNEPDLSKAVTDSLSEHGFAAEPAYLEQAFKRGHFCLLLDGFDEVAVESRAEVAKQIREFATRYPLNWVVVSSRPDIDLNTLEAFTMMTLVPLDLEAAVDLVDRLPSDEQVKTRFIESLENGLFETHESFLSNPLLLSIMLLTYSVTANIPAKLSLFYNQAYEVLFDRHDALKGAFRRDRRTGLDIADFAKAFSAFCILSYDRADSKFSRVTALAYFEEGKRLSQEEYAADALLADSLQAVCLLIEDGLDITFAHRSFQEYFVAKFVADVADAGLKDALIKRYAERLRSDAVIDLLYELDATPVERVFVLPNLDKVIAAMGTGSPEDQYLNYVRLVWRTFRRIGINEGIIGTAGDIVAVDAIAFCWRTYPDFFVQAMVVSGDLDPAVGLFVPDSDRDGVSVADLRKDSEEFRYLFASRGLFGSRALARIIELRDSIAARHVTVSASLTELILERRDAADTIGRRRIRPRGR